jgi:peroxiredoxin family protein
MMKKEMEKIDMPDVREFLEILTASGVKLWACKLAMDMFHYKKEDLFEDLDGVLTVGDFYKQGSGVGTHMLFI